eukprot:15480396-Alexandrium_andersonii.AAC.1
MGQRTPGCGPIPTRPWQQGSSEEEEGPAWPRQKPSCRSGASCHVCHPAARSCRVHGRVGDRPHRPQAR